MFEIRRELPVPTTQSHQGKYPFEFLDVGDHFFVPEKTSKAIQGSVSGASKKYGIKMTVRQHEENGIKGVMVWRAA